MGGTTVVVQIRGASRAQKALYAQYATPPYNEYSHEIASSMLNHSPCEVICPFDIVTITFDFLDFRF